MTIYEQIMADKDLQRVVLVKFGFGEHNIPKVERWFKSYWPPKYHEFKRNSKPQKVVQMTTEGMSKERRNRILDKEAAVMSLIEKGEWDY
jgi:hypothetical protein